MKQDLVYRLQKWLKNNVDQKFNSVNSQLDQIAVNIQKNITDVVNKSIMSVKDSIIDALKEENVKIQSRVEQLEEKLSKMEIVKNNPEQYTKYSNIEIQGILVTVTTT